MLHSEDQNESYEFVQTVVGKHGNEAHKLIPILQEIQSIRSYLSEDVMHHVADALGITPGTVFGVATFYSHFTLSPKGKHIIKVCDGTPCHVKKSEDIIKTIEHELGLSEEKSTTDDMLFTLEIVACVGVCGLAPVIVIDEEVHGEMTREKTIGLINKLRGEESVDA